MPDHWTTVEYKGHVYRIDLIPDKVERDWTLRMTVSGHPLRRDVGKLWNVVAQTPYPGWPTLKDAKADIASGLKRAAREPKRWGIVAWDGKWRGE